jgi:hypothetical protein
MVAMATVLLLIAALFVVAPVLGVAVFGIPAPDGAGLAYVLALNLRALALGLYLLGLARFSSSRVVGVVLSATMMIPVGDMLLVAAREGLSSRGTPAASRAKRGLLRRRHALAPPGGFRTLGPRTRLWPGLPNGRRRKTPASEEHRL